MPTVGAANERLGRPCGGVSSPSGWPSTKPASDTSAKAFDHGRGGVQGESGGGLENFGGNRQRESLENIAGESLPRKSSG